MIRISFVCLGNICRSPTAEAVFQKLVNEANLASAFQLDSAGTSGWHEGELADARSRSVAASRGVEITSRSRQFLAFDYVIAMDSKNRRDLEALTASEAERSKIYTLREFESPPAPAAEVPDPYYGGDHGFENVLDICQAASEGLLEHLRGLHSL